MDNDECVFCAKIRNGGDAHGPIMHTNDPGTVRFRPLNPVCYGHTLFVPRRHEEHPYNIGKATEALELWAMQWISHNADVQGYNVIRSRGAAASQTVLHPHVHFVPRRIGDGLPLPWTPVSKVTGRMMISLIGGNIVGGAQPHRSSGGGGGGRAYYAGGGEGGHST